MKINFLCNFRKIFYNMNIYINLKITLLKHLIVELKFLLNYNAGKKNLDTRWEI